MALHQVDAESPLVRISFTLLGKHGAKLLVAGQRDAFIRWILDQKDERARALFRAINERANGAEIDYFLRNNLRRDRELTDLFMAAVAAFKQQVHS